MQEVLMVKHMCFSRETTARLMESFCDIYVSIYYNYNCTYTYIAKTNLF